MELSASGAKPADVEVDHAEAADDQTIRRAGLQPLSQPGILLTGHLRDPSDLRTRTGPTIQAPAVVVLRSERLVDVLGRQFGALLGERGAQT